MNKQLLKRAHKILEAAYNSAVSNEGRCRIEAMQVHVGYAEPGYGTLEGDDIIVTGDFNECSSYDWDTKTRTLVDDIPERVAKVLESAGIEIEWNDEWAECCECYKLVRTSADSYGWTASFALIDDCEIICSECLEENPEEHLKSLEGFADKANTLNGIHPEEHDYVCIGEFERGFHPGQDDDPRLAAKALEELGLERWLFNIDNVGQFDTRFSLWIHESEIDSGDANFMSKLTTLLNKRAVGPSVSQSIKRGLEEASRKMGNLSGEGIKYAKINEDGTADVKNVSAEDFIKGKI